jgi:hypothetical protein
MGSAEELLAMTERGELEAIEPSVDSARNLLSDAKRSLATCRAIAGDDPKSALLLSWDGVIFPLLAGALALTGYRVTSRQGHHRIAVEAGRELFGAGPLFFRIGALRRARDRTMYENDPPAPAELEDILNDCEELVALLQGAVSRAG